MDEEKATSVSHSHHYFDYDIIQHLGHNTTLLLIIGDLNWEDRNSDVAQGLGNSTAYKVFALHESDLGSTLRILYGLLDLLGVISEQTQE